MRLPKLFWLLLAASVGAIAATQPFAVTILTFATLSLLLLAVITPLAASVILLILAPLRTLIATESVFQLPIDVGQISLIFMLGSFVIFRVVRRQSLLRLNGSPLLVAICIFIIATLPSVFNAASLGLWINEWLKWVQIGILIVVISLIGNQSNWQWLLFGLACAGVANSLVGLYEFLGGSGALHLLINDRFFRAFGTFGQPNPFGGFMGLLAPITLMAAYGYGLRWWAYRKLNPQRSAVMFAVFLFYAAATCLVALGLFISWSRGAWLGFVVSMGVVLFALPRKIWQSFIFLGAVGGLIGVLWLSGRLPEAIVARVTSADFFAFEDMRGVDISPENYPVVERLAHWQAALNMIQVQPWIGIGFGNYEAVYPEYRLMNWHFPLGHAHNYYLNIWAETGMIGLLGYGLMWLMVIKLTWQVRHHPDLLSRSVGLGFLGTWTYLAVHSIFDNLYVNNLFLHLGVMFGILSVLYNQTWKPTLWGKN